MKTLERQLLEYGEYQKDMHRAVDISALAPPNVFDSRREPPRATRAWAAVAAAALVVLLVGAVPFVGSLVRSGEPADTNPAEPSSTTLPQLLRDQGVSFTGDTATDLTEGPGRVIASAGVPVVVATEFGHIEWTRIGEDETKPGTIEALEGGGYVAWRVPGPGESLVSFSPDGTASSAPGDAVVWYSSDGTMWEDRSLQDSIYAQRTYDWRMGDWLATYSVDGENYRRDLWKLDDGLWHQVEVPSTVDTLVKVESQSGIDLIVGVCNKYPSGSRCEGRPDWIVAIDDAGNHTTYETPWRAPAFDPGLDPLAERDLVVLPIPGGGFAAYLLSFTNYIEEPATRRAPRYPTEMWVSDDGLDWSYAGEVPFAAYDNIGPGRTATGVMSISIGSETPRTQITSTDGYAWTEPKPGSTTAIEEALDLRRIWVEFYGEDPHIVETPIGSMVTHGGYPNFALSRDGGESWAAFTAEPPWESENQYRKLETTFIATSDFLYAADTRRNELWIGVIRP